ncbi:MAG TPA: SHOCT domain-containing protein [Candidatus Limnocylindria bacterium]
MPMTMTTTSWSPLGVLITLLVTVFVVASVVWLVLLVARAQSGSANPRSALAILEERLARGEIGVDDYQARRGAIEARR